MMQIEGPHHLTSVGLIYYKKGKKLKSRDSGLHLYQSIGIYLYILMPSKLKWVHFHSESAFTLKGFFFLIIYI